MGEALKFAFYVSAVAGHLVPRPNSNGREYFGAVVSSTDQQAAGAEPVIWDEERVIPILPEQASTFVREFARWFQNGALKKRTAKDFDAWIKVEEKREEVREAEIKKVKDEAEAAANPAVDAKAAAPQTPAKATEGTDSK